MENGVEDPFPRQCGVLCLTTQKDNILMWSHYAREHKGICYEFGSRLGEDVFRTAFPVTYKKEYPAYRYVVENLEEASLDLLTTKYKDWAYEKEWRIIAMPGGNPYVQGPGTHKFAPQALTGIIFGCRADEDFKQRVREMAAERQHPVQLYQAKIRARSFTLDIESIE